MELFILKLAGIISTTLISLTILLTRKNDIELKSVLIVAIFNLLSLIIIYLPLNEILTLL